MNYKLNTSKAISKSDLKIALVYVIEQLEIPSLDLVQILGITKSFITKFCNDKKTYIDPLSKQGELSILLIKLYACIHKIFRGSKKQCLTWMYEYNHCLMYTPIEEIKCIKGLVYTVTYMEEYINSKRC